MKDRLKVFLQMEGLTSSQFAEKIGVQRAGMTHILAGRNKPSFDFLEKITLAFPNFNTNWLITGKGKPYQDPYSIVPVQNTNNTSEPQNDTINQGEEIIDNAESIDIGIFSMIDEPEEVENVTNKSITEQAVIERITDKNQQQYLSENINIPKAKGRKPQNNSSQKAISKIILLFTDGTFEVR